MTLDLERLCEETARRIAGHCEPPCDSLGVCANCCDTLLVRQGFTAAITALEQAAGEFDEKAAKAQANMVASTSDSQRRDFLAGIVQGGVILARWQFEQDKARIGLAEKVADHHIKYYQEERAKVRELEARLEKKSKEVEIYLADYEALKARLAESERLLKVSNACDRAMQDKLARAEERVQRLRDALMDLREDETSDAATKLWANHIIEESK